MNLSASPSGGYEANAAWARYWASGIAHSCPGTFGEIYAGCIGQFWMRVCSTLDPTDRVLDVATGNGAVPLLMTKLFPGNRLPEIDAVDLAPVKPRWLETLPPDVRSRIRFHPRTAAEQLPFGDGGFSVVTSQYGIEYSDLEASAKAIRRALNRDGRIAAVIHHHQSSPVGNARQELLDYAWLEAYPNSLFELVRDMIPLMAQAASRDGLRALQGDARAQRIKEQYNRALQALAGRIETTGYPDLLDSLARSLTSILAVARTNDTAQAISHLDMLEAESKAAKTRCNDLVSHALDPLQINQLARALAQDAANSASVEILSDGDHVMGWAVSIGF